mmetsp:Transcript_110729/g.269083  ORF Transcript_110729/g.269083 Transcript_110729/m.269083 type:complete len:330 (-) Transcript_110729:1108-2097(-)
MFSSCMTFPRSIPSCKPSWTAFTTPGRGDRTLPCSPSSSSTVAIGVPSSTMSPTFTWYFTNLRRSGGNLVTAAPGPPAPPAPPAPAPTAPATPEPAPRSARAPLPTAVKSAACCVPSVRGRGANLPVVHKLRSATRSMGVPGLRSCKSVMMPPWVAFLMMLLPCPSLISAIGWPILMMSPFFTLYSTNVIPGSTTAACTLWSSSGPNGLSGSREISFLSLDLAMGSPGFKSSCRAFTLPQAVASSSTSLPVASFTTAMASPSSTGSPTLTRYFTNVESAGTPPSFPLFPGPPSTTSPPTGSGSKKDISMVARVFSSSLSFNLSLGFSLS